MQEVGGKQPEERRVEWRHAARGLGPKRTSSVYLSLSLISSPVPGSMRMTSVLDLQEQWEHGSPASGVPQQGQEPS